MDKKPAIKIPPPATGWIVDQQKMLTYTRWLIIAYLILLVFEGALRKWALPQFSNPLLIIRDPVVLLIYFCAWRARLFTRNLFLFALVIISIVTVIATWIVLQPYVAARSAVLVTAFGFRCNFLHLPLIFVIGKALDAEDVERIGRWALIGMIPMALLMAVQFRADPDAWINRTVGLGEGEQITAGGGKIRPPATFSFVSGAILYLTTCAVFLLNGALRKGALKNWLLLVGGFFTVVGIGVSGSRGAVASVGLVVLSLAVILLVRPRAVNQFGRILLVVAVVAWAMSYVPIFYEGLGILSDRFRDNADAGDSSIATGLLSRFFEDFTEGLHLIGRVPSFGYGLGVGTNGGARLVTGRAMFLLAEGEWPRVLLENGPLLGLAYLGWRLALAIQLGLLSLRALARGDTLPTILFSAAFVPLLTGQFGQPTTLGFAVVLSGFCFAAMKRENPQEPPAPLVPAQNSPAKIPSRSAYAARLHGAAAEPSAELNGSLNR